MKIYLIEYPTTVHRAEPTESDQPLFMCLWDFTPKKTPADKCSKCGKYGSTTLPESSIRCIFIERY